MNKTNEITYQSNMGVRLRVPNMPVKNKINTFK